MDTQTLDARPSILSLPDTYGIKVEDVITFSLYGHKTEPTRDDKEREGAGILLVAKHLDALIHLNYSDEEMRKVGGLVAKNLMTCTSAQVGFGEDVGLETDLQIDQAKGGGGIDGIRRTVELMLKGLLEKDVLRSKTVHVNSNEPAVVINQSARMAPSSFKRAADETIMQLQQDWNIWPVRVYAGPHLPVSDDGFSVTLLNVVNTDIGGPSMVQLLDAPSEAQEWNQFAWKDVWRGRDFVSREEREGWSEDSGERDDASELSLESEGESVGSEPLSLAILKSPRRPKSPLQDDQAGEDEAPSSGAPDLPQEKPLEPETEESASDSVLAETRPQDLRVPERQIEHPTWDRHDDKTSLLDLIRSQASIIAPFGTAKEDQASMKQGEDSAARPQPTKSESSGDEEYFVV